MYLQILWPPLGGAWFLIDYALDGERKDVADLLILFIKRLLQDEEAHVSSEREEVLAIKKLLRTKIYLREFVVAEIDKRVQLDVEVLTLMSQLCQIRQSQHGNDRSLMTNEQVVLQKFLWLLQTSDPNTLIHAVKVVANLAAKEANQEPIMAQAGISLLAMAAAEDPRTLCMVAGAIANICGNNKLLVRLMSEGVIETLFGMVRRSSDPDVLSQVARGISNFANCEIRAAVQGKSGRTLLIKDDALLLIVQNANNEASLIRRHTELAVCHLVQHEVNARSSIQLSAKIEHPVILRSLKDSSNLSILINYSIL